MPRPPAHGAVVDLFRIRPLNRSARTGGETLEAKPLDHARARIARRGATGEPNEAIAVIGMAGRFPGAANVDAFWDNLRNGVESIRVFSHDELEAAGVPESLIADPRYVRARGVLDGVELFDAGFFGYTPREAEVMDPQHRVFLECAWEALERSGYDPARYGGLIGVFAGANLNTYAGNLLSNRDALAAIGGVQSLISIAGDFLPTRVSYKLNLRGPSVNIQTACSTSLVRCRCVSEPFRTTVPWRCRWCAITVPHPDHFPDGGLASRRTCVVDRASQGTVPGNGAAVCSSVSRTRSRTARCQAVSRGASINNDGTLRLALRRAWTARPRWCDGASVSRRRTSSITYLRRPHRTALGDP